MDGLHQGLHLRQQLRLTPQQIQVIHLIQTPVLQLEQAIKRELEENPALEEGLTAEVVPEEPAEPTPESEPTGLDADEEYTPEDYSSDDDEPADAGNWQQDEPARDESIYSAVTSMREALIEQLSYLRLSPRELHLAQYIIGNLDDDGYLRCELDTLRDELFIDQNLETSPEEMAEVLRQVQTLEPHGVGARTLQECLLLQLAQSPAPEAPVAMRILRECYHEFTNRQYENIAAKLALTDDELRGAMQLITGLNPKPIDLRGNNARAGADSITPDFQLFAHAGEGRISVTLSEGNRPMLHVNPAYQQMLEGYDQRQRKLSPSEREAAQFARRKVEAARQFISAIDQRNDTLMRVMTAIATLQHDYLLEGDVQRLRPMILKDVATATGLDISTISRVVSSKYVQTPFGIIPLKAFFSEASTTADGSSVSSHELKAALRTLVMNEDKRAPLSDDQLVVQLAQQGYQLARRTVAKYREQLQIPTARLRRQL